EWVSLKMCYGGMFAKMGSAVKYMGGEARTFQLDVDELCWFLLEEFAVKCGCYNKGDHIYYLIPDAETFEMGLRRVYSDDEVRVMSDVMVKFRCISCYVVAAVNSQSMAVALGYGASEKTLIQSRKKLSPRRKKSQIVMGGWGPVYHPIPLSPLTPFETFADLQAEQYDAENYEAQNDENANGEAPIYGSTGQLLSEEDVDDESESQGLSSGEEWGSNSDTDDEDDYGGSGDELNTESEGEDNEGILSAVATELPSAEHRHCARHIFASWHRQFKGDEMKGLFWKAAKAYNEVDFNDAIEEMEQVDPGAVIAFKAHNPSLFCRAFVKTDSKCDVIMSNRAETFNGYIIHARNKHLIYMLEDIRAALMQRMVLKRTEMEKNPFEICPRVQDKLEKEKEEAAHCLTLPSNVNQFQVNHRMDSLVVDLQEKTCTCGKWDLIGIPCCHAVACIFWMHKNAEDFVSEWYKKDTYLKAYSGSISPCPGERHWPSVELPLDPPPIQIGPGRPRKNRRKHPTKNPKKKGKVTKHEVEMKCSICKSKSHNKRKCPDKDKGPTEEPAPKRRRGRPSKDTTSYATLAHEMTSPTHHNTTAEPSRTGRGGRMIRGGRGSRGGGSNGGGRGEAAVGNRGGDRGGRRGGGRGGRRGGRTPTCFGVLFSPDGTPYTNVCQ
ncbi:Antiviral helicase SKI2, partial [Bienertia sinuspersici]